MGTITRRPVCTPSGSVHPHGRGDNYRSNFPRARFYGSPPRAWGQLVQKQPRRFPSRFTPTGVGTMPTLTPSPTPTPVHPHGRGDNGSCCGRGCGRAGSPPRAWGQSVVQITLDGRDRFTPTGVGTIPGADCSALPSPRFTPTGVGTIGVVAADADALPVHPHGRGDNVDMSIAYELHYGSPPRAWGQCLTRGGGPPSMRFTPTGVGTISSPAISTVSYSVHPHGRGDNMTDILSAATSIGSPPRAWGQ